MEYRNNEQVAARAAQLASVSSDDIEQLNDLLVGVRTAADLMESLIREFDGEIDVSKMSGTVDGTGSSSPNPVGEGSN